MDSSTCATRWAAGSRMGAANDGGVLPSSSRWRPTAHGPKAASLYTGRWFGRRCLPRVQRMDHPYSQLVFTLRVFPERYPSHDVTTPPATLHTGCVPQGTSKESVRLTSSSAPDVTLN